MAKIFLAVFFALTVSSLAQANHHEGPCKADIEKLCKDVKAGHGAIMKCMKDHESEVSAECKASWEAKKEQMKDAHEACHEDREKVCAGKEKRELMKCMRQNKEKLSAACQAELKEMKEMRKK